MNRLVRAGGLAAAALTLAVSAIFSTPSTAGEADLAPSASYLDHASAEISDEQAQELTDAASKVVALASAAAPRPRSLPEMVEQLGAVETADAEQECLANAVYFEARGEPIEGQLAVAQVVLNRAGSGKYPAGICEVVTQPWQFSFIVDGKFPVADKDSAAWRKAVAIARIAQGQLDAKFGDHVLWYHADYVAPGWGKRLTKETKIGLHIFYS